MSDDSLIIYEEDITQIEALISKMLKGAEAKCALLVDKDGHLITRQGFTHSLDTTALAALLAGSFASTKEIARLVGEPEFSARETMPQHAIISDGEPRVLAVAACRQRGCRSRWQNQRKPTRSGAAQCPACQR